MNARYRLNAELIREVLTEEGRKISWLAKKADVSRSLVDKMLYESHVPKWDALKRVAEVLGIEVDRLLIPREAETA